MSGFRSVAKKIAFLIIPLILLSFLFEFIENLRIPKEQIAAQAVVNWPMAGANPQRTSWTDEDVKPNGNNRTTRIIDAYIPHKVQVVGYGDKVYISAADGVHALNYSNLNEVWHYRTSMPAGHSPTIARIGTKDILFVGVYDKKIHALDVEDNGKLLWTFEGEAGFDNNPLVIGNTLYIGGRDGYFYSLNVSESGASQNWRYNAGVPLTFSPAYADEVLYFGDQTGRAYALQDNGTSAQLKWRTQPISGAGFTSYWPVIYDGNPDTTNDDRVIFNGGHHYGYPRANVPKPWDECGMSSQVTGKPTMFERCEAWPSGQQCSGCLLGPDLTGNWINASHTQSYLHNKPFRQTVFVLNRSTGTKAEEPPVIWQGNASTESRAPAVVHGQDNLAYFYQAMLYESAIPWARASGWTTSNSSQLYVPCAGGKGSCGEAADKPGAIAAGGSNIYIKTNRGKNAYYVDVNSGSSAKISIPNINPGYDDFKYDMRGEGGSGSDTHGIQNAPIPFQGAVYFHSFNTVYRLTP